MNEETLASVLSGVVRRRAPHEARDLTYAIAICDECGRAQAKGRRKAVGLAALKMYTSEYPCVYVELNAAIRNNDAAAIEPYGRYVRTMVEAMLVSPRFEGSTVYRGIKLDMRAACKKGAALVWPEFASCTSSIETQETFLGPTGDRTLFVLTLTQGRARSIADVSMIPGESEVLLPPNTRVTVESTYCAGNGLLLVNASEMPTECMLAALEIAEAAEAAQAKAQAQAKAEAARKAAAQAKAKAEADLKEAARKAAAQAKAKAEAERKEVERKAAERKAEAAEADKMKDVEATKKAKRRRFITVGVVLARIMWVVTRVTLSGTGTAIWLVVRLVSFVVQWLFESDEWPALLVSLVVTWLCESDYRSASAVVTGVLAAILCRSCYGGCLSREGETKRREEKDLGPVRPVGPVRPTECNKMTPSLVSASAAAMGGLAVIIAAAHLLTRLCEYRERRAFLF